MKKKERKIELENKVIEKIAESLVFIAKEIHQKEKELNTPSRDSCSAFSFNVKNYGSKSNRNRICAH